MMETPGETITRLRGEANMAEQALLNAVRQFCPAHHPYQHRDSRPPWCLHCGRNDRGIVIVEIK